MISRPSLREWGVGSLLAVLYLVLAPGLARGVLGAQGAHCAQPEAGVLDERRHHGTDALVTADRPRLRDPVADGCSHCPHHQCPVISHCVAGGLIAISSGGALLALPTPTVLPDDWLDDRPPSANPTPPIPPPQATL